MATQAQETKAVERAPAVGLLSNKGNRYTVGLDPELDKLIRTKYPHGLVGFPVYPKKADGTPNKELPSTGILLVPQNPPTKSNTFRAFVF